VVIRHLALTTTLVIPPGIASLWFDKTSEFGVRVFFVISGFLITNLLLQELKASGTIRLPKFYFRRTLRIFLPYYFFLLVVIVLYAFGWVKLASADILYAITYTVNYNPERSWDVGHAWSLSLEEQFYLLWPAVLILAGKRRGLLLAFSFAALAPLLRLGYYYFFPALVDYEVGYRFETAADAVAVGCLLAGTHEWLGRQPLYHRVLRSRLLILVPLAIMYAGSLGPGSRLYLLFGIPIQNVGIAVGIAWCVANYNGRVGKVLNSKPMAFVGKMSYSIYLWQQLFLNPYSASVVSQPPLNILLVGVASLASYYLVERPSL